MSATELPANPDHASADNPRAASVANLAPVAGSRAALLNSFSGVTTRAIGGFSRIGVLFLIASKYGPSLFGKVSLAFSVMEIFRSFSEFGLDTIALRKYSHAAEEEHAEILGQVLTSKIIAAAVFYVISLFVVVLISHEKQVLEFAAVIGISVFTTNIVGALSSYHQSQLKMVQTLPRALLAYSLYVGVSVWAIYSRLPLVLLLGILPISELLYFALLLRQRMHLPRLAHNVPATVALFRESLPLGVMSAMIFLYVRFDSMVVYRMMGSTALAFYAICLRIVEPALMVPNAFSVTLLSVLSASGNNVKVPSRGVLRTTLQTLWPAYIFITGIAVVLIFAGRPLLGFFNSQYIESLSVLRILTVLLFVRTTNVTLTALINSTGRCSTLARITVSNVVVNVVLVLILVRTLGVVGAAWAAFGTEFWNMCAQWGCVLRVNRVGDLNVVGEVVGGTACE